MKRFISLALGAISLALLIIGCEQASIDTPTPDGKGAKIVIEAGVNGFTKATDTAFEEGDKIGVFIFNPAPFLVNAAFTMGQGGSWNGAEEYEWYADNQVESTVVGYYPYTSDLSVDNLNATFSVKTDQSTLEAYKASDAMFAVTKAKPEDGKVALNFNHLLSKIVIDIDNKANDQILSLSMGDFSTFVSVSLEDQEMEVIKTGTSTIKALSAAGDNPSNLWSLITVPQTVKPYIIITTASGKTMRYDVKQELVLESGKEYTATLVIDPSISDFTVTINDWTDAGKFDFELGAKVNLANIENTLEKAYSTLAIGWYYYLNNPRDKALSNLYTIGDLMCDDMSQPNFSSPYNWMKFSYTLDTKANYVYPAYLWRQLYTAIGYANNVISELNGMSGTDQINKYLGGAYALRAWTYFWLANLYQHPALHIGSDAPCVPIIKTNWQDPDLVRNTISEVYDQIQTDLMYSLALLDDNSTYDTMHIGRSAALLILANVSLFTRDYTSAINAALEVIEKSGLVLDNNYITSGNEYAWNSDNIWVFPVSENNYYDGNNSYQTWLDSYSYEGYTSMGVRMYGSNSLVDRIPDNDVRKAWFGYKAEYDTFGVDFSLEPQPELLERYLSNKFRSKSGKFDGSFIIMRLPEAYLIAAEAYYLSGDESKALELLNKLVQVRTGQTLNLSGEKLYDEIIYQKRLELWGEGRRLLDAKRHGVNIDRSVSSTHPAILADYNALYYSVYDNRMILPIPQDVIDRCAGMVQNPGY